MEKVQNESPSASHVSDLRGKQKIETYYLNSRLCKTIKRPTSLYGHLNIIKVSHINTTIYHSHGKILRGS
jgi:hypothetical protein